MLLIRALRVGAAKLRCHQDPVGYFRKRGATIGDAVEFYGAHPFSLGSEPYLVTIGAGTTISHEVDFITHDGGLRVVRDKHPGAFFYAPITIGTRVFIGARAVLLPGVTVGDGAVVAAGSVVSRDVAPGTVVAGVPARVINDVASYVRSRREHWVDTSGLNEKQKADLLRKHFARRTVIDLRSTGESAVQVGQGEERE